MQRFSIHPEQSQPSDLIDLQPTSPGGSTWALGILWSKRRYLAKASVIGLVLATCLAFLIPKTYESTARLMPPDNPQGAALATLSALTGKGQGLMDLGSSLLGGKQTGEQFIGILRSDTVEDRLIDKFDLRRVYRMKLYSTTRKRLSGNTVINEDRKSGIISITVTDRDPVRARDLAQAYVDELNRLVSQLSTSAAHRERVFLETRLSQVRSDLDVAQRSLSEFSSKNVTIDLKEQARAMVGAAASLQGELIAAESELRGLEQIYAANNVRVRSLKARVDELKSQLAKMGGQPTATGTPETFPGIDAPTIRSLPLLGVTYADLFRQVKVQETVYEVLTQQLELAKVQEAKEIPSVRLLDPSQVPDHKAAPPRLLTMVAGTVFAFLMASTFVITSTKWKYVSPDDPRKSLLREIAMDLQPVTSKVGELANSMRRRFRNSSSQSKEDG